jgi:hypothetical protein
MIWAASLLGNRYPKRSLGVPGGLRSSKTTLLTNVGSSSRGTEVIPYWSAT